MRLRSAAIPTLPYGVGNLITLKFTPASFSSGNNNAGIYWKNAADHTQAFGLVDGFDFTNGGLYSSLDFNSFSSQGGSSNPAVPTITLYSVNAAGADVVYIGGTFGGFNGVLSNYGVLAFSYSAGTTPFNGIRMEIDFAAGGPISIAVPATINFVGGI